MAYPTAVLYYFGVSPNIAVEYLPQTNGIRRLQPNPKSGQVIKGIIQGLPIITARERYS
jgi:hypothetical protein